MSEPCNCLMCEMGRQGIDRCEREATLTQRAEKAEAALVERDARIEALERQVAELREALRPFAVKTHIGLRGDALVRLQFDSGGQLGTVTVAQVRRTAELLAKYSEPATGGKA